MLVVSIIVILLVVAVVVEFLVIKYNGTPVAVPDIPRGAQTLGNGPALTYVVMGDSTAVGQGTTYDNSYAVASAKHLAEKHTVTFVNVGVSGARVADIADKQIPGAIQHKPDVVLIAAGANDTTHFTSSTEIQQSLRKTVAALKLANPAVKIVVTRSPAMDSVPRFPWPAKQLMGLRTSEVNKAYAPIIEEGGLELAPIAEQTREAFLKDPTLFAQDKFHPNDRGYALWIPIVNSALDRALQ